MRGDIRAIFADMPNEPNPFAPPQTSDLEGRASSAGAGAVLSEESLQELAGQAPLLGAVTKVALVILVLSTINAVFQIAAPKSPGDRGGGIANIVVGVPLSLFFISVAQRCAQSCRLLGQGDRGAVDAILEEHTRYFKVGGIVVLVALGAVFCYAAFAFLSTVAGVKA
jgi:hypothetical protein